MKKAIVNSILDLVMLVNEGLDSIAAFHETEMREVLATVQDGVICIGDVIEQGTQDTEALIRQCGNFAEKLYDLSIELSSSSIQESSFKQVKEEWGRIAQQIKEQIIGSAEVLFLPYKAAMWDSLESIYRAFKEDEAYHTVVMPIPYYNLGRNREVLNTKYEGNEFPGDIEITDYRKYSIREKTPDVIFIHNPYDEYNVVTQVPEEYFSSELKKYTDHLVYIPYKVCSGKVKDMYCVQPGVRNAWRVFVQSEEIKKTYLKYNPENKIVALGSPKIDRIVNAVKGDQEIPEEWKKLVKNKTVFLLNIHLTSIINTPENMMAKLKNIFSIFNKRDDLVLLWRPHPLSLETFRSMQPLFLNDYLNAVDEFKRLPNGIFDESADIYSALQISDAYIGDRKSSIVTLFGVLGKPIYTMLNTLKPGADNILKRYKDSFRFYSAALEDDFLWFCTREFMCIFRYDLKNRKIAYIGSVDDSMRVKTNGMSQIFKYQNKLFMICGKEEISYIVYDIDTGISRLLPYFGDGEMMGTGTKYIRWNQYIYTISESLSYFGYIDMDTEQYIDEYDVIMQKAAKQIALKNIEIRKIVLNNNNLFILLTENNYIIKYSLENRETDIIDFSYNHEEIINFTYYKEKYYFLMESNKLAVYDNRDKKQRVYLENEELGTKDVKILFLFCKDDNLWLIPSDRRNISYLNLKTNKFHSISYPDNIFFDSEDIYPQLCSFGESDLYHQELLLYPYSCNMLLRLNLNDCCIHGEKITFPKGEEAEQFDFDILKKHFCLMSVKSIYYEAICDLEEYLDLVKEKQDIRKELREEEFGELFTDRSGTVGKKIYRYIDEALQGSGKQQ